jgi:hypothetical protein
MEWSLFELHVMGGTIYMTLITLMLFAALGTGVFAVVGHRQNATLAFRRLELMKQIGVLAAAWGIFSTIIGFAQAFRAIEVADSAIPFDVIAGGMWVGLITVLYGLLVYCLVLFTYIFLSLILKPARD